MHPNQCGKQGMEPDVGGGLGPLLPSLLGTSALYFLWSRPGSVMDPGYREGILKQEVKGWECALLRAMSRDIVYCHKSGYSWHLGVEAKDVARYPTMPRHFP